MDFGSILYAAQKNEKTANKEIKCYKTKFEPPKKEAKSSNLSVNIQNYLKKRDEEERKKAEDEKRKKEELLALRSQDRKAFKRVQTMLKRTKSANKSVMEDAIDDVNTAVTMNGPQQCDEDDYGYVSQEASAFYAKLMDKYSSMPPEEPKFPQGKKSAVKDLNAAKDRVRAALQKEEEEEMMPHKRKRKSKSDVNEDENGDGRDHGEDERHRDPSPEPVKPKKLKKAAPPPMDFSSLLKLAEQKQFEPIAIEKKVKEEDDGRRPMTKKEKMEFERERERRERQMERQNARKDPHRPPETQNRIPRISDGLKDKPNGILGRIPKKSSANQSNPDPQKFNEGLKRKDSVDSDSASRNNSTNRSNSNNNSKNNFSDSIHSNEKSRNRYQVKADVDNRTLEKNSKTLPSQKDYERKPLKPENISILSNKVNSRRHDISDEEQSGQDSSQNNVYDKQRHHKISLSKSSSSKYDNDASKFNSERNGYNKRHHNSSDNDLSDSQSGYDSNHKKRHSSTVTHKQNTETKYKPTEKHVKFSDKVSSNQKRYENSDEDQSDSQSRHYSNSYKEKYSRTVFDKPEVNHKKTETKTKLSDRDSYDKRQYGNSDNEMSDTQSGNDCNDYQQKYSSSGDERKKPKDEYEPSEKKPKFSDKDSYDKSYYRSSNNSDSDSQSGNGSNNYKHSYSSSVNHKQKPEVKYKPTDKNLKLSDRDSHVKRHYSNSDNDQSDSYSENHSNSSNKQKYSRSESYRQQPDVKYKHTEKKPKLSDRNSYHSADNYGERSQSPINSYNDRYGDSCPDSEPEQGKKYVSSIKDNFSKIQSVKKPSSREAERRDNRSSSLDDKRYNKHTELNERRTYEATKKTILNKDKKIASLFEGSDEKDLFHEKNRSRKSLESKKPKQSNDPDRYRNEGSQSKFTIPKTTQSESSRTKTSDNYERQRPSEHKTIVKPHVSKEKDIRRDSTGSNYKPDRTKLCLKPDIDNDRIKSDRKDPNSKPDIEAQRISNDKSKEKSGTTSSNNKEENYKKPILKAEETLKKSSNVWAKPCNVSSPPTKPSPSGLSESQIQRLREMNKKPIPSRPTLPLQGKPSLLKAAAAQAAARAAAQKALTGSREVQKAPSERPPPLKTGDKHSSIKPSSAPVQSKSREPSASDSRIKQRTSNETRPKQFPPTDLKPRQFPPNDLKPRTFPPKGVRPRQFPPPDVKKRPKPRRIIDDSEEDEYDSEMDDFIDDGTDMNQEQISREIQSIFGYDKSRYASVDDDDDECMESNFGQIDREEYISLRIGAKEDYEELMKDLAEKERKKKMKKQMMKQR